MNMTLSCYHQCDTPPFDDIQEIELNELGAR
jgi:hypothetical protein